ncbi:MAG: hypothetical protein OXE41_10645 [Gammaproteobacteria bacterium]|nr:hypothetical protein [Gammaproteobacteria bacterium]MCY4218114.1 hypothetical protein [Gammaproteobacteria bacterium]MCY4275832.1 hypothetical protein [Gammaproteobacteria bacterium]
MIKIFKLFVSGFTVLLMGLGLGAVHANQVTGMIEGQYAGLVHIPVSDDSDSEWDKICIDVNATGNTASVKLVLYSDGQKQEMFTANLGLKKNPNEQSSTYSWFASLWQGGITNFGGEKRLFEGNGWRGYLGITNRLVVQMNNSVVFLPDGTELSQVGGYHLDEKAQCDRL